MGRRISSGSKRFIIGLWLTFLYLTCVSLVVFSLSAYLFQVKVNSLPKKTPGTNSQFKFFYCDTSVSSPDTMHSLSILPCLPEPVSQKFYTSAEILRKYSTWKNLTREAQSLKKRLQQFEIDQKVIQRSIEKLSTETESKDNKFSEAPLGKDQLELQKELLLGNIKNGEARLREINSLTNTEERGQLSDIYTEIEGFQTFFKLFSLIVKYDYYWAVPKPILKIVLILSMGVLGSLIFVTIEFIKEPIGKFHQRCTMYFFRPFLGMILALAMYVMIKSGQSVIVKGADEDLSPFLISFLGIISGMLAERAYRRLALTGGKVLGESSKDIDGAGKKKGGTK